MDGFFRIGSAEDVFCYLEKGIPFDSFFAQECSPRVCILDGRPEESMFEPDFAAIVISADK